jgi:hypothetical protein
MDNQKKKACVGMADAIFLKIFSLFSVGLFNFSVGHDTNIFVCVCVGYGGHKLASAMADTN